MATIQHFTRDRAFEHVKPTMVDPRKLSEKFKHIIVCNDQVVEQIDDSNRAKLAESTDSFRIHGLINGQAVVERF